MAYKIFFTDLEVQLSYIRADNATAAERLGRALLSHIERLQDFPRLGVRVAHGRGLRMLVHFPVRNYYRIHEDQFLIEILHFWHRSRLEPRSPL